MIQIPDERAGEVPKAFVVKSVEHAQRIDQDVAKEIMTWVAEHKASYKWSKGGVEFINMIPKSPSGKILRRLLRDEERLSRSRVAPKL